MVFDEGNKASSSVENNGMSVLLFNCLWLLIFGGAAVVAYLALPYFNRKYKASPNISNIESDSAAHNTGKKKHAKAKKTSTLVQKGDKHGGASPGIAKEKATHSPMYVNVLKGFAGSTSCVAINKTGTKIVVSSSDATVRVYMVNPESDSLAESLLAPTYLRSTITGDFCSAVDLSFDDQFVFGALDNTSQLVKLKVNGAKPLQEVARSQFPVHQNTIRFLSASKGPWIITGSEDADTELKVFNYSLEQLYSFDTNQVKNFSFDVSPANGRFFGSASWSPGVKVMEILTDRSGAYKRVERAMDLGTPCGVHAFGLSHDHKKAITACKDGTLILWNINVRYVANEDPKQLLLVAPGMSDFGEGFIGFNKLMFSSDDKYIVGVSGKSVKVLNAIDLTLVESIDEAHSERINSFSISPVGNYFITGANDNRPRVWKLPKTPVVAKK